MHAPIDKRKKRIYWAWPFHQLTRYVSSLLSWGYIYSSPHITLPKPAENMWVLTRHWMFFIKIKTTTTNKIPSWLWRKCCPFESRALCLLSMIWEWPLQKQGIRWVAEEWEVVLFTGHHILPVFSVVRSQHSPWTAEVCVSTHKCTLTVEGKHA